MLSPKRIEEILPIFDNVSVSPDPLELIDVSSGELSFPKRTIPYPLVLAAIATPTFEALMRNRKIHYVPAGARLAPMNRLWTFDKLTPSLRDFKAGRASHKAVEQIYHHVYGVWSRDTLTEKFSALVEDFTWNTDHALGLICRFRIVCAIMESMLRSGKIGSLGSIACGSGEAVALALQQTNFSVMTAFIDTNVEALQVAQERTICFTGVHYFQMNAIRYQNFFQKLPFEALELTGLIDYLPDDVLVKFLRCLKQDRLKALLTSNILKKPGSAGRLERAFLHHALQWPMIYRTHSQLRDIFASAGYDNIQFINEPYGLFTVIVWLKR